MCLYEERYVNEEDNTYEKEDFVGNGAYGTECIDGNRMCFTGNRK